MKQFRFFSLITIAAAIFSSCTKEGPAGPAGPQGQTGATGATGATGTANVIYSDWFTPSSYTATNGFGGIKNIDFTQAAPGITQDVLDKGVVLTYGKLNGYSSSIWPANQVAKLPILVNYISGGVTQTDTWSAFETAGSLRINFVNNTNLYGSISNSHSFRYVIIPGGNAASRTANPDLNDYNAVCEFYNIPK